MKTQKRSHKLLKHSLLTLMLFVAIGLFVTAASQPSYASITQYITAPTLSTPTITASASKGYDSAKIVWTAVEGAEFYDIYYATSSTGSYQLIGNSTGTSFTQSGLTSGKTYYFKVMAGTSYDTTYVYSSLSNYKAVTPIPGTPIATAASFSYTKIKVSWTAVAGATGYRVYRATSSTGSYTYLGSTTNLSYTSGSLTTGKTYYYKAKAYRTVGTTQVLGIASTAVSARPYPATPSCAVSTKTATKATITWTEVDGATKYQVYRATGSPKDFTLVYTAATGTKSYVNTGLTTNQTYYYKVRAYHLEGTTVVHGKCSLIRELKLGSVYGAGVYKIGTDIPAGEYLLIATNPEETACTISYDAAGQLLKKYIYSFPNTYFTLQAGDYVTFRSLKAYPINRAPMVATDIYGNLLPGQYKIGRDIPAGTYVLYNNDPENYAHLLIESSSTKNILNIVGSKEYFRGRCYVTVDEGQYLTFNGDIGYPVSVAPEVDTTSGLLPEGMYLVGKDILPGLYRAEGTTENEGVGYFAVYSDARHSITSLVNSGTPSLEGIDIQLVEGQYIFLREARLRFMN